MKSRLLFLILAALLLLAPLAAQCNGELSMEGNKYILQVWGTHYERGYAQGYLLAPRIMQIFSNYFFPAVALNSVNRYNTMLSYYATYFETDPRFLAEAEGLAAGMLASGESLYHAALQRDLNVNDILLVNAIVDIPYATNLRDVELACSSLTSYAEATQGDPVLQGGLVITRFMDWVRNTNLITNPLLVVHHPAENDEVKWMSFTYPGLIGALSGINEYGHASFLNMGNIHASTATYGLDSVLLSVRKGLEIMNYNSDQLFDWEDDWAAVSGDQHISGTIIHNVWESAGEMMAQVIETNNTGTMRRYYDQNGNLNGRNLAATNHFRILYPAAACYRYDNIQDSLAADPTMSADRQWSLLGGAAGISTNLMAIQYQPGSGTVRWSVATPTGPAWSAPPWEFDADDLFSAAVPNSDPHAPSVPFQLSVWPNPCAGQKQVNISSSNGLSRLGIYNLRGQLLYREDMSGGKGSLLLTGLRPGVYLIKAGDTQGKAAAKKLVVY
jgi:hypothetical protein